MNRRRVCSVVLLAAMLAMTAAARAEDTPAGASSATAGATPVATLVAAGDATADVDAATPAAASVVSANAAPNAAEPAASNTTGAPPPGAAAAPAGAPDAWGWNFVAAYDILDSSLTVGAENGTCTLCLGRDIISGWHFGGSKMMTQYFGFTFDYSGHNTHGCWSCADEGKVDLDEDDQFFLGGMTLLKQITPKIRIFGEALGGAMLAGARNLGPGHKPIFHEAIGHHWGPSLAVGGGVEVKWSKRFGYRIFQFDYIWGDMNMTTTGQGGQWGSVNDVRMSTGVIMHIGGGN